MNISRHHIVATLNSALTPLMSHYNPLFSPSSIHLETVVFFPVKYRLTPRAQAESKISRRGQQPLASWAGWMVSQAGGFFFLFDLTFHVRNGGEGGICIE